MRVTWFAGIVLDQFAHLASEYRHVLRESVSCFEMKVLLNSLHEMNEALPQISALQCPVFTVWLAELLLQTLKVFRVDQYETEQRSRQTPQVSVILEHHSLQYCG